MKSTLAKSFLIGALLLPFTVVGDTTLSDKKVLFRGDSTAMGVCRSVVQDDPNRLRIHLRMYRNSIFNGRRFELRSPQIMGAFSCNDMALRPFAEQIGAVKVSSYLRGGKVEMEESLAYAH